VRGVRSVPTPVTGSDHVTGLCCRAELQSLLAARLPLAGNLPDKSANSPISLMICDVIGLKEVNDSRGFQAGDAMLSAAARQLQSVANDAEMLARLGGDELIAVYTGPHAGHRAAEVVSRLRESSAKPTPDASRNPQLRAAWGEARPQDTPGQLIDRVYASMRAS